MHYDVIIEREEEAARRTRERFQRARDRAALRRPKGPYRCFAPAVQVLTAIDPAIENKINELSWRGHRAGRTLEDICAAIMAMLRKIGFNPAISVQEVYTSNMPSFEGETVMTALILIDLRTGSATSGAA